MKLIGIILIAAALSLVLLAVFCALRVSSDNN